MKDFNLRKYLKNNPLIKENIEIEVAPYDNVLEIIKSYEDDEILKEFEEEFFGRDEISKDEFFEFSGRYYDDMSELSYTQKNWEYIITQDEDVFNDPDLYENKKPLKEEIEVDIDLMMGADAKYIGSGRWPFSKFLPHFEKYWSDRGLGGGDSDFIAQGLENHVDAGLLTDDEVEDAMYTFWHS